MRPHPCLQDVQVVAREAGARRDRHRAVRRVALEPHAAGADVERSRAFLLPADVAHVRIRADRDLGHRVGVVRTGVETDVVLDDRDFAPRLGDDETTRMDGDLVLGGREDQLDGRRGRDVPADEHHRDVGERSGVDRRERILREPGVLPEVRLHEVAVALERRPERRHESTGRGRRGERRDELAVDEHEPRGRLGRQGRLQREPGGRDRGRGRLERHLIERRQIGEAPVLFADRRQRQSVGAFEGRGPQTIHPRVRLPVRRWAGRRAAARARGERRRCSLDYLARPALGIRPREPGVARACVASSATQS